MFFSLLYSCFFVNFRVISWLKKIVHSISAMSNNKEAHDETG